MTGPASAVVTAPAAATTPPNPYEPVSEAMSSTQPSPTIDSGSRPMNAASTIGRACGVRSTWRYGLATRDASSSVGNAGLNVTDEGPPCPTPSRSGRREPEGRPLRESVLEDGQLVPHGARQLVADLLDPLGDLRTLGPPLVLVDGQRLAHLLGRHVQALDVERLR